MLNGIWKPLSVNMTMWFAHNNLNLNIIKCWCSSHLAQGYSSWWLWRLRHIKIVLLGIRMRMRCLTWSTWKVWNGEARSAGKTTLCCPLPICSWVSERSISLAWWHASHFLSPLSCHLSSFCWAVNRLPYIWTRSGVVFYPPSPRPQSPCHCTVAQLHPEWHVPKDA